VIYLKANKQTKLRRYTKMGNRVSKRVRKGIARRNQKIAAGKKRKLRIEKLKKPEGKK
jgi:hypothetical protein